MHTAVDAVSKHRNKWALLFILRTENHISFTTFFCGKRRWLGWQEIGCASFFSRDGLKKDGTWMLVTIRFHIPAESRFQFHRRGNLKSDNPIPPQKKKITAGTQNRNRTETWAILQTSEFKFIQEIKALCKWMFLCRFCFEITQQFTTLASCAVGVHFCVLNAGLNSASLNELSSSVSAYWLALLL